MSILVRVGDEEALATRPGAMPRRMRRPYQGLADDTRYKALRRVLPGRTDRRQLAPAFLAAPSSPERLVRHARQSKDSTVRREMVRRQFKALWDDMRRPDSISSAAWTGRPSVREKAAVIQALAHVALEAVRRMIDNEAPASDDRVPVDADHKGALHQPRPCIGRLAI